MIKWLKNKYYIWQYTKWYNKWNPYYATHPEEFKSFIIWLKWNQLQNPDNEVYQVFIDCGERWLKENE